MAEELARYDVVHEFISDPDWGHTFDLEAPSDPKVQQAIDKAVEFLVEHGK